MSSYFNWNDRQAFFNTAEVLVDGVQYEWVIEAVTGKKGLITYLKDGEKVNLEGHVVIIFGEDDDT